MTNAAHELASVYRDMAHLATRIAALEAALAEERRRFQMLDGARQALETFTTTTNEEPQPSGEDDAQSRVGKEA